MPFFWEDFWIANKITEEEQILDLDIYVGNPVYNSQI